MLYKNKTIKIILDNIYNRKRRHSYLGYVSPITYNHRVKLNLRVSTSGAQMSQIACGELAHQKAHLSEDA